MASLMDSSLDFCPRDCEIADDFCEGCEHDVGGVCELWFEAHRDDDDWED